MKKTRSELLNASPAEWRSAEERPRRSIKELLLAPEPRFELDIPPRGETRWRKPEPIE